SFFSRHVIYPTRDISAKEKLLMRPASFRHLLPAVLAALITATGVSAQTNYLASDLSPAGSLFSQFNGAGGTSAPVTSQSLTPTRDFPDARNTYAFAWSQATQTRTNLDPGKVFGQTTYANGNTSTQFVGSLNEADGFGGSHYVALVWNSATGAATRLA